MPRRDLITYPKKVGYRKHTGMVAWLLHRITGVIAGLFFIFHVLGVSGASEFTGGIAGNSVVQAVFYGSFLFHAFNGFRIVLMEFGSAAERSQFSKQFYVVVFLVIIALVFGVPQIFA